MRVMYAHLRQTSFRHSTGAIGFIRVVSAVRPSVAAALHGNAIASFTTEGLPIVSFGCHVELMTLTGNCTGFIAGVWRRWVNAATVGKLDLSCRAGYASVPLAGSLANIIASVFH